MTDSELVCELIERKALIVHCSRLGKGDEGSDGLLFPDDLACAIEILNSGKKELCCSVIWPGHVETFGDVGIILKPRSTASISQICTTDGGTYIDSETGKRIGAGVPFSEQAVQNTFANATGYNEWNVRDADAVGILVKSASPLPQIARLVDLADIPGYEPTIGRGQTVGPANVTLAEIHSAFPELPIYTIAYGDIFESTNVIRNPYT